MPRKKKTDKIELGDIDDNKLVFKANPYHCVRHGRVTDIVTITTGNKKVDGHYCGICYAEFIANNSRRVTPIKE